MAGVNVMALPPGFGFHPTDVELVDHYLKAKILGKNYEVLEVIPEIDLYKHEPWDLPDKSCIPTRDCKWHFFSANDRKYANGSRKNRATEAGYWKATGKDRNIYSSKRIVGTKKTLVFHKGRAPQGRRTDWVMHEYHLNEQECQDVSSGMHDSYVLCRISKKNGFDSESADVHPVEAKQSNCPTLKIAIKPGCELKVEESVGIIEKVEPIISSDYVDEVPTDSIEELLSSLLDDPEAQEDFDMDNDKSERREDMLNQGKMEYLIATPNSSEDLVNLGYHEADFSIDHAGIWLADLESSILEDFVYPKTSNHEIANKSTYKDPRTSVGSYLENPASLDSKNHSETSLTDEEKLLEEMYTAATGELFNCPTQMHQSTADGVSLSDILYGDEWLAVSPSTSNETVSDNGTGIKIRQRNREFPPENFAGHKVRLQVHKMESGTTGEVETCKYAAPSVAVLSEHYEPLDHLDSISPSKYKDSLAAEDSPSVSVELQSERNPRAALRRRQTAQILSRKPSKHKSEILLSDKFSGLAGTDCAKSASKDLCNSGKLRPKCLEDAVCLKSSRPTSVSGPGCVSCIISSVKNESSSGFVDAEQPRGGLRGFIGHLRRYLSTGLNWMFPSLCVLGTSLLMFYVLVRNNVCRYVKGTSTLKL